MTNRIAAALGGGWRGVAAFPRISRTRALKTVLLADRDLGFVFWLGAGLATAGYLALPAQSRQDAEGFLKRLEVPLHLLIVACSLPHANTLVRSLRRSRPHLKIIALTDDAEDPCPSVPQADLYHPRSRPGEASETQWVETIQGVLA